MTDVDEWGKKRLAYEIQKMKEAYYYFIHFEADATCSRRELEKEFVSWTTSLRYLCVRKTRHKQEEEVNSMNKVILMGRLTRDPEVRYSAGEKFNGSSQDTHWQWTEDSERDDGEADSRFHRLRGIRTDSAEFAEKYLPPGY